MLDAGFVPHPDLTQPRNRILQYLDATGEGVPLEGAPIGRWQWHGTMTTVVAAGSGYLSQGQYRGLAYGSDLVLVKVARDSDGIGEYSVSRGLEWALQNRVRFNIRVLNMSVQANEENVTFESDEVDQLAEEAVRQGITVVVAAGNTGTVPTAPANSPSVITVGGINPAMQLYGPSSFGETVDGILKPELVAMADRVPAPILPGTVDFDRADALTRLANASLADLPELAASLAGPAELSKTQLRWGAPRLHALVEDRMRELDLVASHYKYVEGTSFAAPRVAATAALLLEANPDLTPLQIKQILAITADRLPGLPPEAQGFGRVNPARAVEMARREPHHLTEVRWFAPPHLERGRLVFRLFEPAAAEVAVACDRNDWQPMPMARQDPDSPWTLSMPIPGSGCLLYKYVVDGKWMPDPSNGHRVGDGFDGLNSQIWIAD